AGVGNGRGTGAAAARLFAKEGYAVAIVARGADAINKLSDEINKAGGEAAAFHLNSYSYDDVTAAWTSIKQKFSRSSYEIRAAIWNVGHSAFKKFMDVTPQDIVETAEANMNGAFAFSKQAIIAFQENTIEQESGAKGTLIFTGATASLRGNVTTSIFAAGKFALRALSQSLNKAYGKENIHVSNTHISRTDR
ncbi:hypothetical protein AGABI2DRAFT_78299, partial [Agaricus bisporus var. bisporus H97]|uniref:hypothetical protein n=1 Tax=Agaricus bisporus var. bisporus (strain H97 / ATCC MYA-4626 / FGSC 10389) TaxID=936046 RepID=UPI00029F5BA2